jgi:hypothetical protein
VELIIGEIVNNVRNVDKEVLSPEVLQQIIQACVRAVREDQAHHQRKREEQSVAGPWSLHSREDR